MAGESSSSMRWLETCGPLISRRSRQKLTAHFEHAGFSRVHHLANGDLILCGPVERDSESDDPEEGRFDGVLWVGDIEYEHGAPILVRRRRVLERRDVSRLSVLEAPGFRPPAEDELLFTAFNYRGGEVMGVHLATGYYSNLPPREFLERIG